MSGLAGIFKFDPENCVCRSELTDLANEIDCLGPDGGGEYLGQHCGMAYRAFHTTPESLLETQPLARGGCILAWDGRLDNREKLSDGIGRPHSETATDAELVLAAYEKWGTECFAHLLGDWALSLWDDSKRTLLLSRDCFGVRTLFYRIDGDGVRWCSTLKPLVLNAPSTLTLDFEHLAGCICPYPRLGTTPYMELRAVLPAHFLAFQPGGKFKSVRYWALRPDARIRYSTDTDYEEHFRLLFRAAVKRRIRSDRTILCELSGGLDSSSIVCMADDIRVGEGGPEITTLSYYDADEPSGDERPYIAVIEELRGIKGHHISISDFNRRVTQDAFLPLPDEYSTVRPGYFRESLQWARCISEAQNSSHARVILSGLGGDEFLGGIQYEALEIAEYLFAARPLSLLRATFDWCLARRKPLLAVARDTWRLCWAKWFLDSFTKTHSRIDWLRSIPAPPDRVLRRFSSWRSNAPSHLCAESTRYTLASMLSCIDPPLIGLAEKRYPYLDRQLYEFMTSIPREQVLRPQERRSLMRRSLRGLVPETILHRQTKWFGQRSPLSLLRDHHAAIEPMFDAPWLSDGALFDVSRLRERLAGLEHGNVVEGIPLRAAISMEQWLRSQATSGRIRLPDSGSIHDPPIGSLRRRQWQGSV